MSAEGSSYLILLVGVLGVLVVVMVLLGGISRSLLRIERRLEERGQQPVVVPSSPRGGIAATSAPTPAMMKRIAKEGDFMAFLAEDPARRTMPKRDQFAAYRKWRKERGLSWPHDPEASDKAEAGDE